jgi:hypothetical protein
LLVNHEQEESNVTTTTTTQKDKEHKSYDNDEDYDEDGPEEDSFFVIMHGLISRAARWASYTLVNTNNALHVHKLSDASCSSTSSMVDLSVPSLLRCVTSQDAYQPPCQTTSYFVNSFQNLLSYHPAHFKASTKSLPLSTLISLWWLQSDISNRPRSSNNSLPTTIRWCWPRNAAALQEELRELLVDEANLDWLIPSNHVTTTATSTTSTTMDWQHAGFTTTSLKEFGKDEQVRLRELFPSSQSTPSE